MCYHCTSLPPVVLNGLKTRPHFYYKLKRSCQLFIILLKWYCRFSMFNIFQWQVLHGEATLWFMPLAIRTFSLFAGLLVTSVRLLGCGKWTIEYNQPIYQQCVVISIATSYRIFYFNFVFIVFVIVITDFIGVVVFICYVYGVLRCLWIFLFIACCKKYLLWAHTTFMTWGSMSLYAKQLLLYFIWNPMSFLLFLLDFLALISFSCPMIPQRKALFSSNWNFLPTNCCWDLSSTRKEM